MLNQDGAKLKITVRSYEIPDRKSPCLETLDNTCFSEILAVLIYCPNYKYDQSQIFLVSSNIQLSLDAIAYKV